MLSNSSRSHKHKVASFLSNYGWKVLKKTLLVSPSKEVIILPSGKVCWSSRVKPAPSGVKCSGSTSIRSEGDDAIPSPFLITSHVNALYLSSKVSTLTLLPSPCQNFQHHLMVACTFLQVSSVGYFSWQAQSYYSKEGFHYYVNLRRDFVWLWT